MKITLAFDVFNKAHYLESVLHSWIRLASGQHEIEAIVVCDACWDGSADTSRATLAAMNGHLARWEVLETPDVYEIAANNEALKCASQDSDYIVFIQDDNWIFTPDWDLLAFSAMAQVEQPGAVAFLAGGIFAPNGQDYGRVEANTPHKGRAFDVDQVKHPVEPGLYVVDFVTRPFMVSTSALRGYGGLGGPGFDILCFDDVDLCLKLQKDGYSNLYLSLDVLNTAEGQKTMPKKMHDSFLNNRKLVLPRYARFLQWRDESPFERLCELEHLTRAESILDL